MSRPFIAAVLAVSMALTGFAAAPARAEQDDTARKLRNAAALLIIGSALANAHSGRAQDDGGRRAHAPTPYRGQGLPHVVGRPNGPNIRVPGRQVTLPRSCLLEVSGGQMRYVMGARCLSRNGVSTHSLPRRCKTEVRSRQGRSEAYAAGCLRDAGFRIAGWDNGGRGNGGHGNGGHGNGGRR